MKKTHRALEIYRNEGLESLQNSMFHYMKSRIYSLIHYIIDLEFLPTYRESFVVAFLHFLCRGKIVTYSDGFYYLYDNEEKKVWMLPGLRATFHTKQQYRDRITRQFFKNGFLNTSNGNETEFNWLKEDDIVFEVGSYVGATTIGAAKTAKRVYAVEPSPRNAKCLRKNTSEYDNISIIEEAAWNQRDTVTINYGLAPDDDSILTPDKGTTGQQVEVPADTIANMARKRGVQEIDFLKVEAEGVEPEIIKGVSDIHVQKVAVDCGDEREGERVVEEVSELLTQEGYEIRTGGKMVYGRYEGPEEN